MELEKYVLPLYLEPVNVTNSRIKYRNSLLNLKKKYYNGMGREKNLPMFFCAQEPQMEVCCGAA